MADAAMRTPDAVVLWDFDGTLAHRPGLWRSAMLTALAEVHPGHPATREELRAGLRSGLHDGFPWHRHDVPHPELAEPDAWWAALQPTLAGAYRHAGVPDDEAVRASAAVRTVFTEPRHWVVFEDTVPALQRLRDAGWRHVVLSNHVPELPALVTALGLGDLIDVVLTSAAIGFEKPHPGAFEAALEAAGRPPRVWMVGDNPVADVGGAEAAGIPALLVRGDSGHDLAWAADRVLAS